MMGNISDFNLIFFHAFMVIYKTDTIYLYTLFITLQNSTRVKWSRKKIKMHIIFEDNYTTGLYR